MNTDPRDRPADPRPDTDDPIDPVDSDAVDRRDAAEPVVARVTLEPDSAVRDDDADLPGDAIGPASDESLTSAIDGASRPDRVAIGLMVGVVVLLVICIAFGFAAR